jgi:hypothetical protein
MGWIHRTKLCVAHGHSPEDAQDFTQAFIAKLLEKNQIALADRECGRFRTFLLQSLTSWSWKVRRIGQLAAPLHEHVGEPFPIQ